ncbi:DUF4346 domain-containing protein [Halotia wernerae UHCC 0503]|nr:DUF4346 domain-containing protein [Halotia wernerae UHCC 0503]
MEPKATNSERLLNDRPIPKAAETAMQEITRGMELKKCRKCGCMQEALDGAERAFSRSEDSEIQALEPIIQTYKARMEPIAYDCIGCEKCWGADATIQLANRFEDVVTDNYSSGCGQNSTEASVIFIPKTPETGWTLQPGDYVVGNPNAAVAVCTLSSRDLAASVVEHATANVAIAGRCDTENIGVEKVVRNLIANPNIRWLILCGVEAKGHRTGDAFLRLKEQGVDANMRVLQAASWCPVLKNLTLMDVARFREQVEIVNLIETTNLDIIVQTVNEYALHPVAPLTTFDLTSTLPAVDRIKAQAPKRLKLDPSGFFIVLPQPETGLIICEHYGNNGQLAHVIEGRKAAHITATVIERGFITLFDHAAYLGRELAKAELSLTIGAIYEQDAPLQTAPLVEQRADTSAACGHTKQRSCC